MHLRKLLFIKYVKKSRLADPSIMFFLVWKSGTVLVASGAFNNARALAIRMASPHDGRPPVCIVGLR